MESTSTLDIITAIIDSGVLVVILVLFIRGEIMSKKVVNQILDEAEKRSEIIAGHMTDAMEVKIRQAVKEGVMVAYLQANESFTVETDEPDEPKPF